MTWTLSKSYRFEASHVLPKHLGKCGRLHGHSWTMTVEVVGRSLNVAGPESGMVIDYGRISAVVRPILDGFLDHHHLNETTGLANPTSEELSRWIFEKLVMPLPELQAVTIEETCTSRCRYARD